MTGQEAAVQMEDVPSEFQEALFTGDGDCALAQVAQSICRVSPVRDIQKLSERVPKQFAVGDPA